MRQARPMKPLPLPLRVAAGLAVTTAERVRELPKQLLGLPVTAVSQVLQFSMRVQQHVTELAIKGDDALSALRPVEDTPSWATFDEDVDVPAPRPETNGHAQQLPEFDESPDPWAEEQRALAEDHRDGENDSAEGLAGIAGYDELTLPQLRACLRQLSLEQLEEILAYEHTHQARASFIGMLARRIGNVHKTGDQESQ